MIREVCLALAVSLLAAPVAAQPSSFEVSIGGRRVGSELPDGPLRIAVDADDDDENGVADAAQERDVPEDDLIEIALAGRGSAEVKVEGGARLVDRGRDAGDAVTVRAPGRVFVQGVRASLGAGDAALVVEGAGHALRIPLTVVGLAVLDAANVPVDATRSAVGPSHAITNDATLPRRASWEGTSSSPDDLRVEVWDPSVRENQIRAVLESGPPGASAAAARSLVLRRPRAGLPFRSPWVRLVGDEMDQQAPGVGERVLRIALRDEVRVRYPATEHAATQSVRVGRPGDEDGPLAARRGQLRIRVLRATPGGMPVVGGDEATALAIARRQVGIANEIWMQCFVGFGDPARADVAVVDPPPRALVAVSDSDGLPARGGGVIRLTANGRAIRPVTTRPGALPIETAVAVAEAIRELGLRARATENAPAEHGAGRSADVVVDDGSGRPVELALDGTHPLGTDARQRVQLGRVDLSDGLAEFDNMTAAAGTLEERTLVKTLADDDPATVDLFIVNHFTGGTRQGEAFIESDGGAITNVLILDRNGIRQEREAWTQSHELGHILLNQPYHPDNVGPDRPWLLMDADSSLGLVTGPKRLSWDECHRARSQSAVPRVPTLLDRADPRQSTPEPGEPYDLGYPRE